MTDWGVALPREKDRSKNIWERKKKMYYFFLIHILPSMLLGTLTNVSQKICQSVFGWVFLLCLSRYSIYIPTLVVYMWIYGNYIMCMGLLFNKTYNSTMGLYLMVSVHGISYFFLVSVIKYLIL